jgi:thiol:disulfide interchange protein
MKTGCIKWTLGVVAISLALATHASAGDGWLENYGEAIALAKKEHKPVLIDFTGSDWCMPCMIMKKRVFDTDAFKKYAVGHLVLLEVDFPQGKQMPPQQFQQNQELGEKYGAIDSVGTLRVPTVTLINDKGAVLATQNGAFLSPDELIKWIEDSMRKINAGS